MSPGAGRDRRVQVPGRRGSCGPVTVSSSSEGPATATRSWSEGTPTGPAPSRRICCPLVARRLHRLRRRGDPPQAAATAPRARGRRDLGAGPRPAVDVPLDPLPVRAVRCRRPAEGRSRDRARRGEVLCRGGHDPAHGRSSRTRLRSGEDPTGQAPGDPRRRGVSTGYDWTSSRPRTERPGARHDRVRERRATGRCARRCGCGLSIPFLDQVLSHIQSRHPGRAARRDRRVREGVPAPPR